MPQVTKEFSGPSELTAMDRRSFMKYMGVLSSMSFIASCSRPAENIYPFARERSEFSKSHTEVYSSVINQEGFAQGILVKSFQGRPIKVEGNPKHPYSLGATTPRAQAALYELYHPQRLEGATWKKEKISITELKSNLRKLNLGTGKGLAFIFPPDHSPVTHEMIREVQRKFPESHWVSQAPWKKTSWLDRSLTNKDLVVSFDEDIFHQRSDALKLSREFMQKKKRSMDENSGNGINKLIVWESSPTLAGTRAQERRILDRSSIWNAAVELYDVIQGMKSQDPEINRLHRLVKKSKTAFFVDHSLHPDARRLETLLNQKEEFDFSLPETSTFDDLMGQIEAGKITTLVSWDLDFITFAPAHQDLWAKVPLKIHLSLFRTPTAEISEVLIAREHFLEAWSDLESPDGNVSIQQPLIKPLHHALCPLGLLASLLGSAENPYERIAKKYGPDLKDGLATGVLNPVRNLKTIPLVKKTFTKLPALPGLRVKVKPDFSIGYGEGFHNPVLQELPKSFTRLTWHSPFMISAETAWELKLRNGNLIEVSSKKAKVKGAVWILQGLASNTLLVPLGQAEDKKSFNGYAFTNDEAVTIKKTFGSRSLAVVQENLFPEDRNPIQLTPLPATRGPKKEIKSFYPESPKATEDLPQWGMSIDLETCIGCQACVVACQVENNIPFVGEDQVKKGRILHWLRVDTYHVDDRTYFQPVPCMHCEKAPCEVVCPVNATVHDSNGINNMVYNRCVGTRYCSNNCPYRVRRFNFRAYSVLKSPWSLGFNPDVSVRDRGVMEKCTYCVQRLKGGDVSTACQQVCPTQAIQFGDVNNPRSIVAKEKGGPRNYVLLENEGARPRTSYLKAITNEPV